MVIHFKKGKLQRSDTLDEKFREKFGRPITDEERRFYELAKPRSGSTDFLERRRTAIVIPFDRRTPKKKSGK